MKKIASVILLIIVLSLSFCSCSVKTSELKERLIIQGIGIDKNENGVSVTIQALNTDVSSNPNGGNSPEKIVDVFTVTEETLSEAISSVTLLTGKDPLMSQNRIIVFGNETAKEGVGEYLDYFIRSPQNRATVMLAVAEETAESVISADLGESVIPARETEQIMESSDLDGSSVSVKVYEFVNMIKSETTSAVLPIISVEEEEEKSKIKIESTAVFSEDKMLTSVDKDITTGILWLKDNIQQKKIVCQLTDTVSATLNVLKNTTRIKTKIRDGKPCFNIEVKCTLECNEITDSVFNKKNIKDIDAMKTASEKAIKETIENSIKKCIISDRTDTFGFGARLKREEPSYYKENITDWEAAMLTAEYSISVKSNIVRIGDAAAALYGVT